MSGARPIVGHALQFMRNRRHVLEQGYAEHGPVFALKLGFHNTAVLIGPEYQELFFTETDRSLNISKAYAFLQWSFGRVSFIAPHETYLRQRPLIVQAFRRDKMEHYLQVMDRQVSAWLERLGEDGEIEITGQVNCLVQDIAGHALLGDAFQQQVGREFWDLFQQLAAGLDPVLPPQWPLPKFRRRDRARARMLEILRPIIAERRRSSAEHQDFLQDFVSQSYKDGSPVEDEILMGLLVALMFAGHETTAGQAAWTLIELARHPAYQARVRQEIGEQLRLDDSLDRLVLRNLEHLAWATQEIERLHPSVDVLMRTVDVALDVGSYTVPAGWQVMTASEIAHNLPQMWDRPDVFDPLRFAPGREEHKQHKFSLIGFGGGTHRCTGMNFANTEIMVIIARLLQRYELELLTPSPDTRRGLGANRPGATRIRYRRRSRRPTVAGTVAG